MEKEIKNCRQCGARTVKKFYLGIKREKMGERQNKINERTKFNQIFFNFL